MNTAVEKMEKIRVLFQAAKFYSSNENNIECIVEYCESADKEFRAIAYEAASMEIGLRDFRENNSLKNWKYFTNERAKPYTAQVYAGLGWAVAQQSLLLENVITDFPALLKYRIADGCGYYDGTFRHRAVIRNKHFPSGISDKTMKAYFQGLGRSLWYNAKADVQKTKEWIETFDEKNWADMWRGAGVAVAYVGGCDETLLKELKTKCEKYFPQLSCGIALAVRSRTEAGNVTAGAELCARFFTKRNASELAQTTIDAECDDYFLWIENIECLLSKYQF